MLDTDKKVSVSQYYPISTVKARMKPDEELIHRETALMRMRPMQFVPSVVTVVVIALLGICSIIWGIAVSKDNGIIGTSIIMLIADALILYLLLRGIVCEYVITDKRIMIIRGMQRNERMSIELKEIAKVNKTECEGFDAIEIVKEPSAEAEYIIGGKIEDYFITLKYIRNPDVMFDILTQLKDEAKQVEK